MFKNWRISSFNGVLLAAYFIPTWAIIAFGIITSPVHGLYDRPSISVALYISDHLQVASMTTVRFAWLLAWAGSRSSHSSRFSWCSPRAPRSARPSGCDEALAIALTIGSVISFASMLMASQVGETEALRLHATELLMMLGTAVVLLVERPAQQSTNPGVTSDALALEQSQFFP